MTAATVTVTETKRRVQKNIDHGIIGLERDYDALTARLAACETEADIDAFRRMATRWEWAEEGIPEHLTWEEAFAMTV